MSPIIAALIGLVVGGVICFPLGIRYRKNVSEKEISSAEEEGTRIINEAIKSAETKKKEALLEAKEEILKNRSEYEKEVKERRADLQRQENRLQQKEENLDRKTEAIEKKEESLAQKHAAVDKENEEIYYILEGDGKFVIDGEEVAIYKGDAVKLAPKAKRQLFAGDRGISYLCIQVKEGSLGQYTAGDAIID